MAFPERATPMSRSNEIDRHFPILLMRNRQGIGYRNTALEGAPIVSNYSADVAQDSNILVFFSCNAGNLERNILGDTLLALSTTPTHHISAMQEAASLRSREICTQRGISYSIHADSNTAIRAGGTGIKVIRPCFTEEEDEFRWVNHIPRPFATEEGPTSIAGRYEMSDVATFNQCTGKLLYRSGKTVWRVMNLHANSKAAHSVDSNKLVFGTIIHDCHP